jgi:hypothetical protein
MTNATTHKHPNHSGQAVFAGLGSVPVQAGRPRWGRTAVAAATAAVVVAGGLTAGSASAASSTTAAKPVASTPASTQYQVVCDLGSGGVSELAAALDACLVPTRTQPFSLIAAIALPARIS